MYAQLKKKDSRKIKERIKKTSIDEEIPEAPSLKDFHIQVKDCHESSAQRNFSLDDNESDLAEKVEEGRKETKDKEIIVDSCVQNDSDSQFSSDYEIKHNTSDERDFLTTEQELPETQDVYDNKHIIKNNLEKCKYPDLAHVLSDVESDLTTVNKCSEVISEVTGKTFVEEKPSAPTAEGFSDSSKNKDAEKVFDITKYSFPLIWEDLVTPYSDEKLSEFYYNIELHESKSYIQEFINQEISYKSQENSDFYKLLVKYAQARISMKTSELKIQDLKKKLKDLIFIMWVVQDVNVTEKRKCKDGNIIAFEHKYTQAQFNLNVFKEFTSFLTEIKYVIFEVYLVDFLKSVILRLKIEYHLQCLLTSCPEFTNLEENSLPVLSPSTVNSYIEQCVLNLKTAISILFAFQRKQTLDVDSGFLEESRQWLSDLVSVLLRVGNCKDHIFLLSHIVRCPGGVSEWAAPFVQLPYTMTSADPFNHSELNHMLTVMSILLSPIDQRENFIKKWESELETEVLPWTVIDSDGEAEDDDSQQSCPLKENDLVLLLNQIPFSSFFKTVLRHNGRETRNNVVSSHHVLKLLAFLTDFIKILFSGLKLYNTQKYRQFSKRLGRLIYHAVQYATDALIMFKSQQNVSEEEMTRIQVEYDSFFLRSTKFIFSAKKHGTWQFLATVPYHMTSSSGILKLYGTLQLNDNETVAKVNFSDFEEKFSLLPEEEQFYLLTTFANMALARNITEVEFIKNVVLQLFFIGFLSKSTMDRCYKNVESLLCSICSSYPFLMSEILTSQQNMFLMDSTYDQKMTLYLWKKLPVDIWLPDKAVLEILSTWLLEPILSLRNELARVILQSLNYGMNQGELFLPVEHHHLVAHMVLQSNKKLVFGNEVSLIKNVSNYVRSQTPEQLMDDWTWNILLKLRIHLLDQPEAKLWKCFSNLEHYLKGISDVESHVELHHLVLKKEPVACFTALMTTTLGHSVPLICEKGFELIEVLFDAGKYKQGIICLEYITLLFFECSDSLYKCEKFIFLLTRLISADNSYAQIAKNLISNNFPGPILKCFESMLQNQMNICRTLNLPKLSSVINMWLMSLTRLPLWTQDQGVLYLIDKLLQNCFFDAMSTQVAKTILENLLQANTPYDETKSSFSSLVSWMNSKQSLPSLLPKGFNGEVPWFSYRVIEIEFENYEKESCVWQELLKELYGCSNKKPNVDNSLKKVCNLLRIPVRSSNVLAIYRWSYQLLETDISHLLVPLMWQKFFSLYLCRVPGPIDRGSVGEKFFEGVINQTLCKRLKLRLEETCVYFKNLQKQSEESYKSTAVSKWKLFKAFSLWFDDPKLHEPCLNIHMLSAHYNPQLLGLIIAGNDSLWIDPSEYHNIEQNFKNCGLTWAKLKNRLGSEKNTNYINHKAESSVDKLNVRLNSYEVPLPPPQINLKKYSFAWVNFDTLLHSDKMIYFVKPHLKVLLSYCEQYIANLNENVSLGCDLQELLPRLYDIVETKKDLVGHCDGIRKNVQGRSSYSNCLGPAVLNLNYEDSKLNKAVKDQIRQCNETFDLCIHKTLSSITPVITTSAVTVNISIEQLRKEYNVAVNRADAVSVVNDLRRTGVHLFYEIVRTWCENVEHTPPVKKAFKSYIDVLGKTFIEGNAEENKKILHLILNDKTFGGRLCKYFTPDPCYFTEHYSTALECTNKKRYIIISKFDLVRWLSESKPKFSERSRLISIIFRGLKSISSEPDEEQNTLELLNQHLRVLLMHDFPEHYGEILKFLLEGSESQAIPLSSWFMFLNSLAFGHFEFSTGCANQNIFEPGQSAKTLKYCFSKYATDQNLLPFEVIKGTMTLLASTFKSERQKAGEFGLFRKYRLYIEPIFILFGMISYSFVVKALEIDTGSLSDKLAQQLWPLLNDLYSPWLIPFCIKCNKLNSVHLHQGHNLDGSYLLPWTVHDLDVVCFCVSVFSESIRFVFDTLPGVNPILSYVWFFYVTNFAHIFLKDYILNVIHDGLLSLPWKNFFPSLQDVELMLRVVDQFLPLSHSFLGNIFISINWNDLVQHYLSSFDRETPTKLHICLLHLLVKLPLEPSLKQSEKMTALLTEASDYAWHLVDSASYEIVLNWFIMSCDPRVILEDDRLEYYKLDSKILRLLKICAGYVPSVKSFHSTTLMKRQMFVRACVKWLITSNRRFKSKDSPLFKSALCNIWSDMETIISETVPELQQAVEVEILLSEFLVICSEPELSSLVEVTLSEWLKTQKSEVITSGLLRSAGNSIDDPVVFGNIVETSLESYFRVKENCEWSEVINILVPFSKSNIRLEKVLIDSNNFLTFYAILMKNFQKKEDFISKMVLTEIMQLLPEVKLSSSLEPKVILLIIFCLKLIENEIKNNTKEGVSYLSKFCDILNNFVDDGGKGFLSAIGFKKSSSSSFKLICLGASSGLTFFLKNNYPEYEESVHNKILQALDLVDTNKFYQNVNQYAVYIKSAVKKASSLDEITNTLKHISLRMFNKPYLK